MSASRRSNAFGEQQDGGKLLLAAARGVERGTLVRDLLEHGGAMLGDCHQQLDRRVVGPAAVERLVDGDDGEHLAFVVAQGEQERVLGVPGVSGGVCAGGGRPDVPMSSLQSNVPACSQAAPQRSKRGSSMVSHSLQGVLVASRASRASTSPSTATAFTRSPSRRFATTVGEAQLAADGLGERLEYRHRVGLVEGGARDRQQALQVANGGPRGKGRHAGACAVGRRSVHVAIDRHAIAAGVLGRVQQRVGPVEQLGGSAVPRGDADRKRHHTVDAGGMRQRCAGDRRTQPLGHLAGVGQVGIGHDHQQLLAAIAVGDVARAQLAAHDRRKRA